jgi:hypothetical protein
MGARNHLSTASCALHGNHLSATPLHVVRALSFESPHTEERLRFVLEAIFRRLRSRSPQADHLSTTSSRHAAGDSRDVGVSFNAHPRMPYSVRVRAHLSTPTHTSASRCLPEGSIAVPAFISIFRCRLPLATRGVRFRFVFRRELQACSTACAVYRSRLASFDARLHRRLGTSFHSHLSMRASAGTHVVRLRADLSTSRSSADLGA